jgi:hypothetical protein
MRKLSVLALWVLAACAPAPQATVSKSVPVAATSNRVAAAAPAASLTAAAPALPRAGGGVSVAQAFMDLTFQMESGRALPWFSRFEGPFTVGLAGTVPASAPGELARLVGRLRAEAGVPVSLAPAGQAANITIEFRPRSQLRRIAPTAACFVVPNVSSLAEYQQKRGSAVTDWAQVRERDRVAIFVPADTSPQEVRDCLHEELAQAMGPLNDLYRLAGSVFNDDNFHATLTSFDMQILRMTYSPGLVSGMTRAEVAQRIGSAGGVDVTPRPWTEAIAAALGGGAQAGRIAAAERAIALARAQGWQDSRLAFSHFALGRLFVASDPARAVRELTLAAQIWRAGQGGQVHVAHVEMQLAAIALGSGQPDQAIAFADRAIPVVRAAENAELLATLMLIKAEALEATGRRAEAEALRLDSRPWASYGFGAGSGQAARLREIAALGARGRRM